MPALEAIGFRPPARRPYAAPERMSGAPAELAADVFSLGAIAFELLTRKRPAGPGEQDVASIAGLSFDQRIVVRTAIAASRAPPPARNP